MFSVMIKLHPLFNNINKPHFTEEYSNIALAERVYQVPERKKKDISV